VLIRHAVVVIQRAVWLYRWFTPRLVLPKILVVREIDISHKMIRR